MLRICGCAVLLCLLAGCNLYYETRADALQSCPYRGGTVGSFSNCKAFSATGACLYRAEEPICRGAEMSHAEWCDTDDGKFVTMKANYC